MAGRHLRELLREEQEPFALKRFIDERRCQLRRPSSGDSPLSQLHRHHHHHHRLLQIKRHVPDVSEARAFSSPPALVKSPSTSPFVPRREPLDGRRPPLLHLPVEKSPSSASRLTAALLLDAAMRIQKQRDQQQQGRKNKRRKRKKKETENPPKRFGLGFLACILKRLVVGKRQRGITVEEEAEQPPFDVPARHLLKWEAARRGENNAVEGAVLKVRHRQQRGADLDMRGPHYVSQADQKQRKGEEGKPPQSPACRRCGIPECPQKDGGGSPSVSGRGSVPAGRVVVSASTTSRQLHRGPSPPRAPSPELQTPAASPDRRRIERQLLGGTGDGGRAEEEASYYEEKKEQFSPVSVLDPPFDEEDHHPQQPDDHTHHCHHHHHHHPELDVQEEEGQEQQVEEDDAADSDVDSFQHSLAVVQRAKQQLLSRIRRFERLAELDPVELEKRLAEEEDDGVDEEHGNDDGTVIEMEAPGAVCELVQAVLGLSGGTCRKIPAATRRLVLDLAEEERRGRRGSSTVPASAPIDGVEKTAEGLRRRFEAWKGVEADTIDMMVEMDLRQEEGDGWRKFPEEVSGAVAEVAAAALAVLVDELMDDLVGYIN